jgi:uncharacterized coiled-coil protein SlyX
LLALRENGPQLTKLAQDAANTDLKMTELRSNISKQERSMKDLSAALTARQASMKLANASADEIATVTIEAATKLSGLGSELDQFNTEMVALKETKAGITSTQAELRKKLDTAAVDSANIYVVARALALGAIGALMSIFAKYLAGPTGRPLFEDSTSLGRMWASIAMGGIVSVVVVGLFFTGFISIFANSAQTTGETDFWKVTILCLLAGAFSDRLFQAASGRMDSYLRTGEAEKAGAGANQISGGQVSRPAQDSPAFGPGHQA